MPRRVSFAAAALALLFAGPAAAQQPDPEPKTPYVWRVVLKAQPHPLLSGSFREQLKRDLAAALQPALGPLGTVEVLDLAEIPRDRWDPLWQQFDDKGFAALDAPRDLTGAKTHFLKLEYQDGQYHLESRQHDGFAGLASPVVRRQSVRAPELVGRTAGLMLDRDFGLAGTVEAVAGSRDEVRVTVRGGQLGPVDAFVKAGDVFAVSQVTKTNRPAPPPVRTATGKIVAPPPGTEQPPGYSANVRQFTLLRVTEVGKDGTLRCAALSRFQNPVQKNDRAVAYRCLKLGTVEAPLTIRLVSADGSASQTGRVIVRATESGFGAPPDARDTLDFRDGMYRSARKLSNVACVTVSLGPGQGELFPLPVLGAAPVNLPFETDPQKAARAAFNSAALAAADRVRDARNAQTICFEETAKLIKKEKNADALRRAKGGFDSAAEVDRSVSDELARLRGEEAGASPGGAKLITAIEQNLTALRQFNTQLAGHVKTLEEVVARENDPKVAARQVQAESLAARITLLLARGDVDEALNAYDQLATLLPENADVKTQRDKLRAEWKPKSDAHAKAREYLLKKWPAVATIPDFKESLPQIGAAVDECIKNGDRHTLRKLLTIFTGSIVKLKELADPLDPNADADRKLAKDANDVGEAMAKLEIKITDFVKKE